METTQTIIYQGQPVQATLVNYLSGTIPTSTVDADGDEELFRDEAGRYYLRRTLNLLADHHEDGGDGNVPASGRTHVHRINVHAAILWATTRLNSETLHLRCDAADLLRTALSRSAAPCERFGVDSSTLEAATRYAATAGRTLEEMVAEFLESMADNMASDREAKGPAGAPELPSGVRIGNHCQRFTFEYAATRRSCGMRRTIEVSDEQMSRAGELAVHFNLSPVEFLRRLADHNNLPGQPQRADDKLRTLLQAGNIAFVCMDEALARRIERAAQSRHQTVDEFVAESLGGDVDMWEETMLVHPATGELLETEFESLFTETKSEMIVPPVGREHELQFKTHPNRKYVRFNAYLTPGQLERLEYPNLIFDAETNEDVPVLIVPFDEDGSPYLEVGGQRIEIGQSFPPAKAEEAA